VSPSWVTFLFEAANFLLLAALLGWIFFRPVRDMLERRRTALEAEEREAAEQRALAERALAEAAARQSELERSHAALRERVREEAEREGSRVLDAAREQAQRERETLEAELAALRRGQAKRIAADAAAAARGTVVRLLEQIEGPDLEQALLAAAGRELAKLAAGGTVDPLIVESAAALDSAALDALAQAAGVGGSEMSTRRTPELGAGIRILTARGLIDASAAGLAAHAERMLMTRFDAEARQND
jgi:F0F1-type ATP synthase membrane subunit b/b'